MDGGSHSPAPPELIDGRYRLSGLIGRGGMASVYSARDERLGRDVAVKLFSSQMADAEDLRRYRAEIELVATFNHSGLVTLFDAGQDQPASAESRPFLTMELINGQDLRSRIQQGALRQQETAMVGAGVAAALDYVHGRGVIHRDIKPANILLAPVKPGEPLNPKLTDFGIARLVDGPRLTATGIMVGTAAYLSPEQVTGTELSPASDIYSLGLVLLECLTGKVEFHGNAVEAAVARLHRSPVIPSDLDVGWKGLLRAMTGMEPSGRPTAAEVHDSLQQALAPPLFSPGAWKSEGTMVLPAPPSRPPRLNPTRQYSIPPTASAPGKYPVPLSITDPALVTNALSELATPPTTSEAPATNPGSAANGPKRFNITAGATLLTLGTLLAIAAVTVAITVSVSSPTLPGTPAYPSISGTLGEHLEQLKKSITP